MWTEPLIRVVVMLRESGRTGSGTGSGADAAQRANNVPNIGSSSVAPCSDR